MLRYSLMLGCQVLGVHATRLASHGDMYLRLRLQKKMTSFLYGRTLAISTLHVTLDWR